MPPPPSNPNVLVGTETFDDAGVYRLGEKLAIVQTLDFFPPLVDDPLTFGQIAAANALSDVYAMNAQPISALNIVGFPDDQLPLEILAEILRGGADRVALAGAALLGGHSVRDSEIKYGLSVTGVVDPAELLTNAAALPGDALVLTKALGTGFITTAIKKGECPASTLQAAVASMIQLNAVGRDALRAVQGVHAVTDVTGFGLAGHAAEMADGSDVSIALHLSELPLLAGAQDLAIPRYFTRASTTNRSSLEGRLRVENRDQAVRLEFAFDAQTSGGLLLAVERSQAEMLISELHRRGAAQAAIVGEVLERDGQTAIILR